ncbi:NAD(P)-binding domain-containing protein [Glutamicibacter uratoxydans]|uniref:NAD(P)-binding domain-containing protein n=1 Tax=Glutamicibacter uratoxydans TaxID=43667 RepID=UPI003D6FAB10
MKFLSTSDVSKVLKSSPEIVRPSVIDTYTSLELGKSTSSPTTFLPIPNEAPSRFITLPAYAAGSGSDGAAGTKWVSNFRGNVALEENPLNTLLLLSDIGTGVPLACIEGSELNLRRTAASAFLAAECFGYHPQDGQIGIIGAGALADAFAAELAQTYDGKHSLLVSDIVEERAQRLVKSLVDLGFEASVASTEDILRQARIIILATSAEGPWIDTDLLPTDDRMILHISADDLPVEYFSQVTNVTDRISDVAKLPVSLGKAIIEGLNTEDIYELPALLGKDVVKSSGPVVYSPFGLSVLDIALAKKIYGLAETHDLGVAWNHRG